MKDLPFKSCSTEGGEIVGAVETFRDLIDLEHLSQELFETTLWRKMKRYGLIEQ